MLWFCIQFVFGVRVSDVMRYALWSLTHDIKNVIRMSSETSHSFMSSWLDTKTLQCLKNFRNPSDQILKNLVFINPIFSPRNVSNQRLSNGSNDQLKCLKFWQLIIGIQRLQKIVSPLLGHNNPGHRHQHGRSLGICSLSQVFFQRFIYQYHSVRPFQRDNNTAS